MDFICLYFREDHRQRAKKVINHVVKEGGANSASDKSSDEEDIPPYIAVLFSAHEFLGMILKTIVDFI